MKNLLSMMIIGLLVTGCGGGGGPESPAEPDTPDLEKDYALSALTPMDDGEGFSAEATGIDSNGKKLSGIISLTGEGETDIKDGLIVKSNNLTVDLDISGESRTIFITTRSYFIEGGYLEEITDRVTTCSPVFSYALPDTVKINDTDNFPDKNCINGQTQKSVWKIRYAGNENIYYIVVTDTFDESGEKISSTAIRIKIDESGKILAYKYELKSSFLDYSFEAEG